MSATRLNSILWAPPAEQPAVWPLERWRQFRQLYNRCHTLLTKRHGNGKLAERSWAVMQCAARNNEASQSSNFWQWERAHFPHGMGRLLVGNWPRTVRINRHHWGQLRAWTTRGLCPPKTWWQTGVETATMTPDLAVRRLEQLLPADPIRQYRGRIEERLWHFPAGTRAYRIRRWIHKQQTKHGIPGNRTQPV